MPDIQEAKFFNLQLKLAPTPPTFTLVYAQWFCINKYFLNLFQYFRKS